MSNEILSEIRLQLDQFRSDLKDAQKAGEDTGKKAGKSFGDQLEAGFNVGWGKVAGALVAAGSAIAGAFTLKEAIAAASEQETAIQSLNSALALSGQYSATASAGIQNLASSLQKTTTAADEAIVAGAAMIENLGHLSGEGLERATKASLDLAAALNIDQASAFNLVAKASSGHVSALARYGIEVRKTGDESRDFAKALDEIEKRFKGLAELQSNTFNGALAQTKNQFGEVLEAVGNIVIQSPTVIAILKALAKAFADGAETISKFAANRDLIKELANAVLEVGRNLTLFVVAPLELAYNTGVVVFNGFKTLIQGMLATIADGAAFVTGILAKISPERFGEINEGIQTFAQSSNDVLTQFTGETQQSLDNIFNFDATAKADQFLANAQSFVDAVKPVVKTNFQQISDDAKNALKDPTFLQAFAEGFVGATKKMSDAAKALGAQVFATFTTGFANAFAAVGAALVKGENGFAAFGKAMLGVLGDIAIQFGTTFIALGVGKSLLFDPTGPALIAAGAALAVIGGALKAVAGGGGVGGGAPSAGGGGVAVGAAGAPPTAEVSPANFNDSQRNEVGTKVEVNIGGNVFDRRETGLQIAEVINEVFGSNGVTTASAGNA